MDLAKPAQSQQEKTQTFQLNAEDRFAMNNMKYAQGLGPSLRYANELRAVQQPSRLFLKSSNLHEDVLRNRLGPGNYGLFK